MIKSMQVVVKNYFLQYGIIGLMTLSRKGIQLRAIFCAVEKTKKCILLKDGTPHLRHLGAGKQVEKRTALFTKRI